MKKLILRINIMYYKRKKEYYEKDTLVIIGNGFDLWQGISSGYSDFRKYYLSHRDSILKRLHISPKEYYSDKTGRIIVTDVEIVYGNPFDPAELGNDFWGDFETSLANIDADMLNFFFGKEESDLRRMKKSIRNANRILREAFCGWVSSLSPRKRNKAFDFGDNCVFINFNYTDTLVRYFNVDPMNEFHIHGEAVDKKSIIFGHPFHPQIPEPMLYNLGGRFRGLFWVEKARFETDKHVDDNIKYLCLFLAHQGIFPEMITNIYVLGHSMSLPDVAYFSFLENAVNGNLFTEEAEKHKKVDPDDLEELDLRLQYAISHSKTNRVLSEETAAEQDAVNRRYGLEKAAMDVEFDRLTRKIFGIDSKAPDPAKETCVLEKPGGATWHISCYSDRDRKWADALMQEFGCSSYHLYSSIDECLAAMKNPL